MAFMDGFMTWLGLQEPAPDSGKELNTGKLTENKGKNMGNVVTLHGPNNSKTGGMKVVVAEPVKYEEVSSLVDHLRQRKQLLINFEKSTPEEAKRIFDFILGALYALDGNSQQISKFVFLFVPSNVEICRDTRDVMNKNGYSSRYDGRRESMAAEM